MEIEVHYKILGKFIDIIIGNYTLNVDLIQQYAKPEIN